MVYDEIRELIFDIDKIVVKIIELFIERIKNLKMSYVPCIIIDIFDPIYTELYNKLIKLQNKNNFRIIIVYQLENKLTNKILLDYLEERKNENFDYKYTRTLYDGLSELPNKYEKFFNYLIPTINSYLQINNNINEKEAKYMVEEEEKRIEKEIYKFLIMIKSK